MGKMTLASIYPRRKNSQIFCDDSNFSTKSAAFDGFCSSSQKMGTILLRDPVVKERTTY